MAMIAAVFCSCGQQPAQERGPRPVKLAEVTSLSRIEKSYSGVVSPDQFSDLAFKMSGPLVAMNVLEGQRVKKGQVVAEIDPTDYKLDYDAKRASFQKASSQMQRAEKLLAKNAISMQEFETTQASYTNAKSAFENAQNTLNDTKLRAPFDGFIQKKYVENYQRVQPGQGVVCLINPAKLQVEFTIPETNISYVTSPSTIYVEFDAYKGKLFQAKVKEYVEASPDGAGVPVFLYIDDPEFDLKKYKVSVGFSCRVIVNIELFFYCRERIKVGSQPMLVQFPLDDGVIIPEDESIFRSLVLCDAEFGIHIVLHTMVVTVQMIGCDVHQHGNIGTELIHIIQLERAELNHIIIMLVCGYLQGKTLTYVTSQSYIQTCTFENVVNK